jgi:hypothetical protein
LGSACTDSGDSARDHLQRMNELLTAQYAYRERLRLALQADLVGPHADDEVLDDEPLNLYLCGVLHPASEDRVDPAQDAEIPDDFDESGETDSAVTMANRKYPSSIGCSFSVDTNLTDGVKVSVTAARYVPIAPVQGGEPNLRRSRRNQQVERMWRRLPSELAPVSIDVRTPIPGERRQLEDGLKLFVRVRPAREGIAAMTVMLLNENPPPPFGSLRDDRCYFQTGIAISAEGGVAAFVERPRTAPGAADEDLKAYRLLYRHARTFAVGHGVSAHWEEVPSSARARLIRTVTMPSAEVLVAASNPRIPDRGMGMARLAKGARGDVVADLRSFAAGYREWIHGQRSMADAFAGELRETADDNLRSCDAAADRIEAGVRLLETDDDSWLAFRLANLAMLKSRARAVWIENGKSEAGPVESDEHRWRPFQLAFFLLCLAGLVDPRHSDRSIADLLWFPTGGGKTEAYLGLIAFTAFFRRLRHGADGVAVFMRYTLRLLTIQQFERAAGVICACEAIRSERQDLGAKPISIGLWVGRGATPNTCGEAREALKALQAGEEVVEKNPVQLHSCPWCGTKLKPRDYKWRDLVPCVLACCPDADCHFHRGLPVYVVDDDLYLLRPTVIIGTADKFAGLPWRADVASLFNLGATTGRPPELIIQDELHLISGPLGTMVGLYESAIDRLCTIGDVRPKVVASTATIRRAGRQSRALFDREIRQFPPAAIDARDTYFAVEAGRDEKADRLFVGLMAPSTSPAYLMVRTYAVLLQLVADVAASDEERDPFWTLVGYFNSLRVLSGARIQLQDDVGERMRSLAANGQPRPLPNWIELTSRESSTDIPTYLNQMKLRFPDRDALDVILATNMISVGVDVDRLSLMVLMGQPQSASEYIQATSRIGRADPGLVVVLFNSGRSRDRSHYEQFSGFHAALYRAVESASVTPFAARARDRGLHAVLVSLARHTIPGLSANDAAAAAPQYADQLSQLIEQIVARVSAIDDRERDATRVELKRVRDEWIRRASRQPDLVYASRSEPKRALLVDAEVGPGQGDITSYPTLRSLRDVDAASGLYLIRT